jgi:TolB-like protein
MERTSIELIPELVKKQLRLLLNQEELKRSPILSKFLRHVVVTKLEGREDEIKEYTIGVQALGRPVDFNPQLDAIVRIHASRLRAILLQYYHGPGKNDLMVISIPKGTYIPVFDVHDGKTEQLHHYVRSQTEINAYEKPLSRHKGIATRPVVAVLPFHNLSPEHSNINFLTALGEQLSSELSRYDNLSILSYYATEKLESSVKDLKEIKNKIGIDYILTGSLRLLNGTLRLNIQLLVVDSGNIVWSDSFLRKQLTDDNAFDIQDEIISQVANIIADDHGMAGTLNKMRTWANIEDKTIAHEAIIQYFDYTYNYDSKKFAETLAVMENAYHSANDNALIASMLSKLYVDLYACSVEQDKSFLEKGMELANKAVQLDPRCQHAHKALAWALILSGNKDKSDEVIDHCIAINPMASSNLSTLGLGLIMMGEYENGYAMLMQSTGLTQNPAACAKLGFALYYYQNRNYEESNRWLERLSPFDIPFTSLMRLALYGKLNGKATQEEMPGNLKGGEQDIISRIVLDPKLRNEIVEGWELAGLKNSGLRLAS